MNLADRFSDLYGPGQARLFQAPGRVNIIGEHTDYNGGFVLPAAVDRRLFLAARPRRDRLVRVHSSTIGESAEFSLDSLSARGREPSRGRGRGGFQTRPRGDHAAWVNYVAGVAHVLQEEGHDLVGLDMLIDSDIPVGAGMSSSAALEVAAGVTWRSICGLGIDDVQLALLCQRAEHTFVGVPCGIMDQFAALLSRPGHALFLDCRSLEYRHVSLPWGDLRIVVTDTGVRRELAGSEYAVRRRQCEEAAAAMRRRFPHIEQLRDARIEHLEAADLDDTLRKRARHVIEENERVLEAVQAIGSNDLNRIGRLLFESHRSLRDLYEVSCRELDILVDLASEIPGVFGSRMMGAGFGGCTISLVRADILGDFEEKVRSGYCAATSITPVIHVCASQRGAGEVEGGTR